MDDADCRMPTKARIARQDGKDGMAPGRRRAEGRDEAPQADEPPAKDDGEGVQASRMLGMRGEEAACRFLKRRGYIVLERNWVCPAGEADIVAKDEDGVLVFVEVKTRSNLEAGLPAESVTPRKRARYERIAGYFLADYDGEECRVRFDVISLLVLGNGRALVRHYVNAFGAGR